MRCGDALGQRQRHAGQRRDRGLRGRGEFQPGLEGVAFEEVEKGFVLVVLDVDGMEVEGDPDRADAEADEDRIAAHRRPLALPGAIGRVEMQVFARARDLVAGVEIEQHAMRPAAGIIGDPQRIERDVDARVLERSVGLRLADTDDVLRPAPARRQKADGVRGVLPRLVAERPPVGRAHCRRRRRGALQRLGGLVFANFPQLRGGGSARQRAEDGEVDRAGAHDFPRCSASALSMSREQSLSVLNVFCGAFAKALKVRERRLGIGAGVVEALGLQQSERDIEAGLSRAEDVARLFFVANALLVMLQRAVDVAGAADR